MDQQSPLPEVDSPPIVYNNVGQRLWTAKELSEIVWYYEQGRSLAWISEKYHTKRSAISGIIYRARRRTPGAPLKAGNKVGRPRVKPLAPPKEKPLGRDPTSMRLARMLSEEKARAEEPKPERVRLRVIEHNEVTFQELERHHCRWPLGDPRRPDFRFCGCTRVEKSPYCQEHTDASFNKPVPSVRKYFRFSR